MSNSTNIYHQFDILPTNAIICKCDPIQELVFTLNDKNDLEEIKNTENYNFHLGKKESLKDPKKTLRNLKIYNILKDKNNSLEFQNATKLVKGFNSVRTTIELKDHQFFLLKYNCLK